MDGKGGIRQKIEQAVLALDQGDYEAALRTFKEVVLENPKFPDVHNRIGLCYAMMDDPAAALKSFEQAIELAPDYAEAHANRGILLTELGRTDEAQDSFDRSVELDHRDGNEFPSHLGNEIALAHAELANLYVLARLHDEAAVQFRKALQIRPRFLDIRVKFAEALLEIGANEQARGQLELVLEENPALWGARLRLGLALQRLGNEEGAIDAWKEAAAQAPHDMRAKAYLAGVKERG